MQSTTHAASCRTQETPDLISSLSGAAMTCAARMATWDSPGIPCARDGGDAQERRAMAHQAEGQSLGGHWRADPVPGGCGRTVV